MSLSLDVEYGVLAKQNLGNGYVNAIKLSSNLEKIVSAINDISSAVKTNIVVRSVNDLLPLNETNDINLNILRPDKNETDVYKEILSSESLFMLLSSEVSFLATLIGKKELSLGGYQILSILVDDNKIFAGSKNNGIFYSEDNGETFEQATGLESLSVKVIKKFFGKYFAGTENSVYQSTDGKNWTIFTVKVSKNTYLIEESVNDLLQVKCGNRKILIVATDNGVVATTNSYAKKTLISGTAYALTKDDKNNVYFSANFSDNGNIYVISIEEINNYLTATDVKKTTEENSEIHKLDLDEFKFGSNVYDILIKDKTLFAAVSYKVENNSRIRSITTKYGIKKAPLLDLSLQSFTSILGIGLQISYLKTNGYGIYTQIKNGSYPTFWFTTNGLDFTSYKTKLNDDISEFDFIDNFTMVAGANGGIIKFKQTADYIRDKLITEINLLANNELLCTYINEQDYNTCSSANKYTDDEISALDKDINDRISSEIDYIKNNTLSSYELISTFTLDYISLGKNTYDNDANKLSNNVAIGKDVVVTEKDSIGLGQNISASGSNNIAVGNNLSTSNTNAIAIGYNLTSDPNSGEHSIAIGYDSVALCEDSIAIGRMISTETSSTTKIGAAFRDESESYNNAETIALELFAKIGDDASATSESKAYITTNRFTENTGTWTETKKEISLEGHKHVSSDIIGLSDEFISYDDKIEYISSYVYTISNDVEKISVDLYSLSSQTSTISTLLCAEISDLSTDIDSQKVTVLSDLSAYVDGVLSSDTVNFPTAAAITLWSDKRYLRSVGFDDPTATLRLLSSMLTPGNLILYIDADNGNDDNDGSLTNPLKTITKAIKIANQLRFIAGSLIYLYLKGTFNIRNEANLYKNNNSDIEAEDKNLDISDANTIFKNSYGLKIYHPDMKAPSYMRISKWSGNDAVIEVDLKLTIKWLIAIQVYCDTIFDGIKFDAKTDVKIYDPDRFLSAYDPSDSLYIEYNNTKSNKPYLIDVKYSKTDTPYTYYDYNNINESFIVSKSNADILDFYNCSCYNFMTAFHAPTNIFSCYFENGHIGIENNLNSRTEIFGLSCKNIIRDYSLWLNGTTYFANANNFNANMYFENINSFSSRDKSGYTLFFNLFFDYVQYYNSNTLTLLDTLNNNVVNRITDTFNIYNYCTSASAEYRVQDGTLVSATIENNHKTIDYIDFLYKFLFNSESIGNDISSKYASYNKDKYNGIITFNCGDYATSSIIYRTVEIDGKAREICYFPFLELLFNIIRENDKTLTSLYDGILYSTTYHAYKLSDIVHLDNNNKISSIDYSKFTISAYKDLFDTIY